jgi:hypothetical protein
MTDESPIRTAVDPKSSMVSVGYAVSNRDALELLLTAICRVPRIIFAIAFLPFI